MKHWCRKHVLLLSCALALVILLPVLFAAVFAHFQSDNTLTWQHICLVLRSEWPAICALLVGVEGLLFSIHFLHAPKQALFSDSETKKSIALVFLCFQFLLLLSVAVVPYLMDQISPSHGWINLFSGFYIYFLMFLCFSPELIAAEALIFFAYFVKSPLKKNRALFAFHIVNAGFSIAIVAITFMVPDIITLLLNWIPASVILILWIIEFAMRRNLKKRKATV